jgi:hypothetical protein
MTAVYDKLGLKFLYPENWKLMDDSTESPQVITLETPDGSTTWSVHVYPAGTDGDAILRETLDTLQQTYEDLEIAPHQQQLGELEANGVEAMFYCLDFLIRAQLHLLPTRDRLLLFWAQAEDRDFDKQQLVFQAITVSLLQSLEASS